MKQAIVLVFILMTVTGFTQQNTKQLRYKQYAGRYGGNSGICLFEDGRFMLYGYATAVFGSYGFEKDYLLLYPDKPELFEVYGHYNKNLGDSIRINFSGFEEGQTFVQFGKDSTFRVFNADANCFDAPFVYQGAKKADTFTLSHIQEENWGSRKNSSQSWKYQTGNRYNDFIWIYNKPKREYEDFGAMLSITPDGEILKLSNYGGNEGYKKQDQDKEELKQWNELLEWKKQYDHSRQHPLNAVFVNKRYRSFPQPDSLNFVFDTATNQYISRQATENEEYFNANQYEDDRFLRKYFKLLPEHKDSTRFSKSDCAANSIFYTVCGQGLRPSYHYNRNDKTDEEDTEKPPLIKTAPVPVPGEKVQENIDDNEIDSMRLTSRRLNGTNSESY